MLPSVSTLAVSWNDAAARKLSVLSDALVTPSSAGGGHGGLAALGQHPRVGVLVGYPVHQLAGEHIGIPWPVDPDSPQHLPHDDLNVLVVDVDALGAIHLLHLFQEVLLHGLAAQDTQDVLGVERSGGYGVAGADCGAVRNHKMG